jgi:PAS domain S-box-containing protein
MDEKFTNKEVSPVSEISIHHLVNVLADATFICDITGRILICSDKAVTFFGISDKSRIINSNFQSYIAYEYVDEAYYLLQNSGNDPLEQKSGNFLVKKGIKDSLFATLTFSPLRTGQQMVRYVLVSFRDAPKQDPGVELLHKKDVRLSRLFETLVNQSITQSERIQRLLSQVGETLGCITSAYNALRENELVQVQAWESPFNNVIGPHLCARQMYDYMSEHHETITLFRKPMLTAFLENEPSYREDSGVKAILGLLISKQGKPSGILTAVFAYNYSFPEIDKQLLSTIAAVLENDEPAKPAEKQVEKVSEKSKEVSFRQLIDCFSDPVCVLSPDGLIMELNKAAVKSYGYTREELIGQSPTMLSADDRTEAAKIEKAIKLAYKGDSQKMEWWGKRKDGTVFPKEVVFNKSKYYDRDAVIAIGRDLSDSKKVEEELLRYNKELKDSNVSKDKFFSILAHDLKNPFQGLLGFIDLLYEDIDELTSTQVKEYLANVRNASYHTYALLENLLEWSRIQSGKMPFTPTVFSIRDEITSVINVLDNNAIQKEINLINEVGPGLFVEADRNMIRSVLQNIITNSIKFSNSNGKVIVRGRVMNPAELTINANSDDKRQWLEVSITDNGIGIPQEILPKLFQLDGQYSQAGTANEPGTGLGLVLCHEMVQKNGGKIWADSLPGQGTTFLFTLPLSN